MLVRKPTCWILFLAVMLLSSAQGWSQAPKAQPLGEDDLLQLSNLLSKAEILLKRLEKAGVAKSVDLAAVERLRKAGVSETVLAAVRRALQPSPAPTQPRTLHPSVKTVACLAWSPDGKTVALGGESEHVELWDAVTGRQRVTLEDHPRRVAALAFAPDGHTLAAGCYKQVKLWDTSSGKELRTLKGHTDQVLAVQFFPDSKRLVSASRSEARVWAPDPEPIGFDGKHWLLMPDGKTVVSYRFALGGGTLSLWDVTTRKKRAGLGLGLSDSLGTASLAGSADGRTVVVGLDESVLVYDITTTARLGSHGLHTAYVIAVDVSPDGKTLASGSRDKTAILWDIERKQERATLKGHTGPVFVKFSPDGRTLASRSPADSFVKLWDVATGKERTVLRGHTAGITGLWFAPDGKTAATASQDGTVRLWNVEQPAGAVK